MSKGRMEAFSDGVLAIIITIMILEIKVPQGTGPRALLPLVPGLLSYILSFVFIGIYWNNHHHLLQAVQHVDGKVLWANMHLLFWLSLIPVATAWIGDNPLAGLPVATYGALLFFAALAYYILVRALLAVHGSNSVLAAALGSNVKGKVSLLIYLLAVALALWQPIASCALYVLVAIMWLVPDRRIEKTLHT